MRHGWTLADIGYRLSWLDIRDFVSNLPPNGESALYRTANPKSWWWTPEVDFLAAILFSLQIANWQRGSGKGARPKPVKKPAETKVGKNMPKDRDELSARRKTLRDKQSEIRRRVSG